MSTSSSSSSSSSNPCPGKCEWEWDNIAGDWNDILNECVGECECFEPTFASYNVSTIETTYCQPRPLGPPPSTSSSTSTQTAKAVAYSLNPNEVAAGFPKVSDLKTWSFRKRPVNGSMTIIPSTAFGWQIIFLKTPGPATPSIVPAISPTDSVVWQETSVAATVLLPESTGTQQYWIPIQEHHRWAQLLTIEWTVILLKAPNS